MRRGRGITWLGVGAVLLGVCSCAHPRPGQQLPSSLRTRLDANLAKVFGAAILYKPQPAGAEVLAWKLSPLVLWECSADPAGSEMHPFAAAGSDGAARDQSVVYSRAGEIQIQGRPHAQLTYLWISPAPPHARSATLEGIRLTLSSAGQPVIWEVLSGATSVETVFVAESLEQAAKAQYGGPLPGRRYSIESGENEDGCPLVARVIDDGPVPMGPIVYLQAQPRAVTTVLCRCMPAQVQHVVAARYYQLMAAPSGFQATSASAFEPCLRLPDDF